MDKILADKNILITGGTSQLGRVFVEKALSRGARVFFTYHQNLEIAERLTRAGASGFPLDLSDQAAVKDFLKKFKSQIKILHGLIHNAACVCDHLIQNMTEAEWDKVLTVNLKAPYYLTKELLGPLFKAKPAKVLMITSRTAGLGGIGISNYAAAKAGLIGLTKSLAQELGKKEVLVNAVTPGFMKSAMTESAPEFVIEANRLASPLGRFSDPEEVAEFLIYLCSGAMTQVTGQVFHFESRKM